MPGYSPTQLNYLVQNANQVFVTIGDTVVAYAQTAPHSIDFGTEALFGIGEATPQEVQQLRITPQITLEYFALTNEGLSILGASNPRLPYTLANNQFNIHVIDTQTNQVILSYITCVAQNFTETISANRPVINSVPFIAMDVLNNSGQSILKSNSGLAAGNFLAPGATQNATGLGASSTG